MGMINHLYPPALYRTHGGLRVRVVWNPRIRLWYVYNLIGDRPIFSTARIELEFVSVYGELRPKYAPDGSPSFVGTIVAMELVTEGELVRSHPYAPSKLYFDNGEDEEVEEFDHCRRVLLDKSTILADRGFKNVT